MLASRVLRLTLPKNLSDPFRAHDRIGGGIPFIGEHLSGLSCHTKPFFAFVQGSLGPLAFGDVMQSCNYPDNSALGIAQRSAPSHKPHRVADKRRIQRVRAGDEITQQGPLHARVDACFPEE